MTNDAYFAEPLKIVIPMAGLGTRVRPLTWSKPKPLVSLAGKTVLDHVLYQFHTLPNPEAVELILIVGRMADQVERHMQTHYPQLKTHFVEQIEMRGQSHAISMARELLKGPMLVVFSDTLIETDLSHLAEESADAVAWVKPVEDPRRFGVAQVGSNGWVTRLIEKPQDKNNNLVVVGFYYFRKAEDLLSAIDEQICSDVQIKGEFFLADAINIMLKRGMRMRPQKVDVWLDTGVPQTVLETNRYLLGHGYDNTGTLHHPDVVVVPPVFVHSTADIQNSVIGPYASIGAGCVIKESIIRNSILDNEAYVTDVILDSSLIGCKAQIQGHAGTINIGDDSVVNI